VSKLNSAQTIIIPPETTPWKVPDGSPPDSVAEAVLAGGEDQDGAYMVLMKWYPGWMSAPHTYVRAVSCAGSPARRIMTARGRTPRSLRS
jgi:hypothetical protein